MTCVACYICNEQMRRSNKSKKPADSLACDLRGAEADLLNASKLQRVSSFTFIMESLLVSCPS